MSIAPVQLNSYIYFPSLRCFSVGPTCYFSIQRERSFTTGTRLTRCKYLIQLHIKRPGLFKDYLLANKKRYVSLMSFMLACIKHPYGTSTYAATSQETTHRQSMMERYSISILLPLCLDNRPVHLKILVIITVK